MTIRFSRAAASGQIAPMAWPTTQRRQAAFGCSKKRLVEFLLSRGKPKFQFWGPTVDGESDRSENGARDREIGRGRIRSQGGGAGEDGSADHRFVAADDEDPAEEAFVPCGARGNLPTLPRRLKRG